MVRYAGLVAELLLDGQGLAVPVLGLIQPAPVLRDPCRAGGSYGLSGLVAEFLLDGQGLAVPVLGLIQPPPQLGDPPSWW